MFLDRLQYENHLSAAWSLIYVNAFIGDLYVQQELLGSRGESHERHLPECGPLLIPHKLDSGLMGQM